MFTLYLQLLQVQNVLGILNIIKHLGKCSENSIPNESTSKNLLVTEMEEASQVFLLSEMTEDWSEESGEDDEMTKGVCTKPWLLRRDKTTMECIYDEIAKQDSEKFKGCFRMTADVFDALLAKLTSRIEKQQTQMRDPISARMRL